MNTEHAKPGDTIEITSVNDFCGQQFLVMECPDDKKDGPYAHCAWVEHQNYVIHVRDPKTYKIVEHRSTASSGADDFLKRQLNDNLRNLFT